MLWKTRRCSAPAARRTRGGGGGSSPMEGPGRPQILPTRSSEGARVASPSCHLAGHTSPGWEADVLRSLDLPQKLGSVAADALGGDFHGLDDAVGVHDEGAAIGEALARAHHFEVVGDGAAGVTEHGVLHLADGLGRIVPRLVGEVGVGGDRIDLDAELLEIFVVIGEITQLGGAHEGEIGRVEEEHRPLAGEVRLGNVDELALLESGGLERLDRSIDEGHGNSLDGCCGARGQGLRDAT